MDKKVQSASEAQSEESVLLDDLRNVTKADNNTLPLGIRSSEPSACKGSESSDTVQENYEI